MPPAKKAGKCTYFMRHFATPDNTRKEHWPPGRPLRSETQKDWSPEMLVTCLPTSSSPVLAGTTMSWPWLGVPGLPGAGVLWEARGFNQCPVSSSPPTPPASFPIAVPCLPLLWPQARVLITGVLPTKTRKLGAKKAWRGNQSCSAGAKSHLTRQRH